MKKIISFAIATEAQNYVIEKWGKIDLFNEMQNKTKKKKPFRKWLFNCMLC